MPLNLNDLRGLKRAGEAAWTLRDRTHLVHNAVNVAELAISKGATTLPVPVSALKQFSDLPDDLITKVNILCCTDAREALLNAIVE